MDRNKLENIIARAWENGRMQYNPSKGGTDIRQDYTDFRCSINYAVDELCEGTKSVEAEASDICHSISDSGSLIIRRVKTKGGDDCKECVFNNASEDVHQRICKPCTLMPSGFHYR